MDFGQKEADHHLIVSMVDTDKYGRKVAEVFTSVGGREKSFNEQQLNSGLARVYPAFVANCPNAEVFKRAEEIAKSQKLGVWGDASSIPPWQ